MWLPTACAGCPSAPTICIAACLCRFPPFGPDEAPGPLPVPSLAGNGVGAVRQQVRARPPRRVFGLVSCRPWYRWGADPAGAAEVDVPQMRRDLESDTRSPVNSAGYGTVVPVTRAVPAERSPEALSSTTLISCAVSTGADVGAPGDAAQLREYVMAQLQPGFPQSLPLGPRDRPGRATCPAQSSGSHDGRWLRLQGTPQRTLCCRRSHS